MRRPNIRSHHYDLIAAIIAVVATGCGPAEDRANTDVILQRAVEDGDVVGVVAMAANSEGVIYQGAFGKQDRAANVDMAPDSVFRIASMTNAVTSVAAMQLVEEGALQLDEPVSTYIPDFAPQVLEGFGETSPHFSPPDGRSTR